MLTANNIGKSYGDKTLFQNLSLNLTTGQRIALIGMNGSGKTTLMDILAGDSYPDTGNVSRKRYTTIGYLRQETDLGSDRTLLEEVLEESPEIVNIRDKIATAYKSFESLSVNNGVVDHSELLQEITMLEASLEAVDGILSEAS